MTRGRAPIYDLSDLRRVLAQLPFREMVTFGEVVRQAAAQGGESAFTTAFLVDQWVRGEWAPGDARGDETSAAVAADTSSGVDSAPEGPDSVQAGNALHERLPPQTSPAADQAGEPQPAAGASSTPMRGGAAVARVAHNHEVAGSTPAPATNAACTHELDQAAEDPAPARSSVDAGSIQQNRVPLAFSEVPRSPDAAGEGRDSRQHPEHQDDGGPGTGCQPSSAAGDGQTDASPAAPDDFTGLTSNERKVLRAILALQTDGAFVTYRTIAERSGVQQDALSYYTKSLEQKGWLRRDGPVSDRRYHVLRNPDGGSRNHSVAQHAWNGHAHSERDHDQAKARSRDSDEAVCSACKRRAASEGDLCTSCAGMVTTCPGVGDGALPHYDDRVRASMAKDVKQRKSRKSRAGV